MTDKNNVSLALGSGGARGLAHIGVIRWLDEHDYQIKVIAGSSIGAQQEELLLTQREEQEKGAGYQRAINNFIEGIQERFNLNEEEEEETSFVDVMTRSIESMQNTIARFKLAAYDPNYLLEVPANACGMFDFYRAEEMIELGYNLMDNMMSRSGK